MSAPSTANATTELEIKPSAGAMLRVTAVLAGGTALLCLMVFLLLTAGGGNLFARRAKLTAYMPDATGLSLSSQVRLSGILVGSIRRIELSGLLDPKRAIRVEIAVLTRYLKNIPSDSHTDISADTLVGDQFLDIAEGKSLIPISENGVLESEPVVSASDRADLMRSLKNRLGEVDQIVQQVSGGRGKLGQYVVGEKEYQSLFGVIGEFDRGLHSLLAPDNQIGETLFTMKLYHQLHDPLMTLDDSLSMIQQGQGSAGKLFSSDEQYDQLVKALTGLRESLAAANSPTGQFAAFLHDDAAYQRVRNMLASTDAALAALNSGNGPGGQLLTSPQVYESLSGALKQYDELLRDLGGNPKKYLRYKPGKSR